MKNKFSVPETSSGNAAQSTSADINAHVAQREFTDTAEEHGRDAALVIFNSRVSAWAGRFTNRAQRQLAYVLGSRMDGDTHSFRISVACLLKHFEEAHKREHQCGSECRKGKRNRRTIYRQVAELERHGIVQVKRGKKSESDQHHGMQSSNAYHVNFGLVLEDGVAKSHDFLRGRGRTENVTQDVTQRVTQNVTRTPLSTPSDTPLVTPPLTGGPSCSTPSGPSSAEAIELEYQIQARVEVVGDDERLGARPAPSEMSASGIAAWLRLHLYKATTTRSVARRLEEIFRSRGVSPVQGYRAITWWWDCMPHGLWLPADEQRSRISFLLFKLDEIVDGYLSAAQVQADELGVDAEGFDYPAWLYAQFQSGQDQQEAAQRESEAEQAGADSEQVFRDRLRGVLDVWEEFTGTRHDHGLCRIVNDNPGGLDARRWNLDRPAHVELAEILPSFLADLERQEAAPSGADIVRWIELARKGYDKLVSDFPDLAPVRELEGT